MCYLYNSKIYHFRFLSLKVFLAITEAWANLEVRQNHWRSVKSIMELPCLKKYALLHIMLCSHIVSYKGNNIHSKDIEHWRKSCMWYSSNLHFFIFLSSVPIQLLTLKIFTPIYFIDDSIDILDVRIKYITINL